MMGCHALASTTFPLDKSDQSQRSAGSQRIEMKSGPDQRAAVALGKEDRVGMPLDEGYFI